MLQDIGSSVYSNEYTPRKPKASDLVFLFQRNQVLMMKGQEGQAKQMISYEKMQEFFNKSLHRLVYLFAVDDCGVYLLLDKNKVELENEIEIERIDKVAFEDVKVLREYETQWVRFAAITALHLYQWYNSRVYCGGCGEKMQVHEKERAMQCTNCKMVDYPKICPAIIVGVVNKDKILLTKYANRAFTRYALIAGFCEIGESVEATIHREVLEEVGVKVKNLRYAGSQPWGFSQSLLLGFFADLDGEDEISLDEEELAEGVWVKREEIPADQENELSLTYTMMRMFREGKEPKHGE